MERYLPFGDLSTHPTHDPLWHPFGSAGNWGGGGNLVMVIHPTRSYCIASDGLEIHCVRWRRAIADGIGIFDPLEGSKEVRISPGKAA